MFPIERAREKTALEMEIRGAPKRRNVSSMETANINDHATCARDGRYHHLPGSPSRPTKIFQISQKTRGVRKHENKHAAFRITHVIYRHARLG